MSPCLRLEPRTRPKSFGDVAEHTDVVRGQSVGLCATCRHAKIVTSARGSAFYLCQRSLTDERFPRYPRLPVLACVGYEWTADATGAEGAQRDSGD